MKITQTISNFLKYFIKVIPVEKNNKFINVNNKCLTDVVVSDNDVNVGIPNSDFHIYLIFMSDENAKFFANANWCLMTPTLHYIRPTFGRINFNLAKLDPN